MLNNLHILLIKFIINMPQLVPFYFINQVFFIFTLVVAITYVLSKYILPKIVRLYLTRIFLTKL